MPRNPNVKPNINRLLPVFPYYGNFSIIDCRVDVNIDRDEMKVQSAFLPNEKDMFEINLYLCGYGFAERRFDIDKMGNQIQLTDKGRKLKELGSIELYVNWLNSEKEKEKKREDENDLLRQTNILSGKIQQNLLYINRWIAVAGLVAALYYIIELVDYFSNLIAKHLPLYYGGVVTIYLLILGSAIGVGLSKGVPTVVKMWSQWKSKRK